MNFIGGLRPLLPVALALALAATACRAPAEEAVESPTPPSPTEEPADVIARLPRGTRASPAKTLPVREGRVIFDVYSFLCGQTLGSEEKSFRPRGIFCEAGISVMNTGNEAVRVDPFASVLHATGASYGPWREAMEGLVLGRPHSLFARAVPGGGGGTATLLFELPKGSTPQSLELHASTATPGTVVDVENCALLLGGDPEECALLTRGSKPGVAFPANADIGVPYPVTFEFDTPRSICFDAREWELSPDHPVPELGGLDGHGIVTLPSSELAAFKDNSGARVWLVPSAANEQDPALCG